MFGGKYYFISTFVNMHDVMPVASWYHPMTSLV